MAPLIEVKNLKKFFKVPAGTLYAVDNVSFTINKGETVGVVGESGCGNPPGRTLLDCWTLPTDRYYWKAMTLPT